MPNLYELTEDMIRLEAMLDEKDADNLDEQAFVDTWEGIEG